MYILFREFHWKPMDFFGMGEGEKIVVRAFLENYCQEKEKEAKELEKMRHRK